MNKDIRNLLAFLALVFCAASNCFADYFTEYVWFNVEPEMSRIVISVEQIRGHKAVDNFHAKAKEFEKQGKYLMWRDEPCSIVQTNKMDGHIVETTIQITPGNMSIIMPSVNVTILFDGKLVVDCPMGDVSYRHAGADVSIPRIMIHTDDKLISAEQLLDSAPTYVILGSDHNVIRLNGAKIVAEPVRIKKPAGVKTAGDIDPADK